MFNYLTEIIRNFTIKSSNALFLLTNWNVIIKAHQSSTKFRKLYPNIYLAFAYYTMLRHTYLGILSILDYNIYFRNNNYIIKSLFIYPVLSNNLYFEYKTSLHLMCDSSTDFEKILLY